MITHDAAFEALAQANIKQTDVKVVRQINDPYGYYDDTPAWTSSDYLMSVKVDCVGAFLGTTTKKAIVRLLGIIDTAVVGIYNADPSVLAFNYISEGFFIVDSVAYDYEAGSTTITMYDHMWTAQNTPYTDNSQTSGFAYPSTIEGLAGQMASAIGVDLMTNFSSLPNADFSILVDPYATISNATLQTVIQEIAAATGTTARISDTTLMFSRFELASEAD
jgi:hypothetical protein